MSNSTTTTYAASLVVSDSPATLEGLVGYNSGASQYIQVHDATSLPADATVPTVMFKANAGENFSVDFGDKGRVFKNGIIVCNSSTGATKTIGSADCWIDAQYF